MNLLKLFLVCFISLILFEKCDKKGRTNTNTTPSPSVAPSNPPTANSLVRAWYQAFVRTSPRVHELPFRLPDSAEREVFEASDIRFVATNNPTGGHPQNDVGDAAREELRGFIAGSGSDDLYYNGLEPFSEERGHDLLGEAAREEERQNRERAARHWVINKFYLRKSVSESIRQQSNANPAMPSPSPQILADYVQNEFESLKNNLTQEQRARLAGWRTSVGAPPNQSPGENLWLKQTTNVLWISPFLARGLLLQSVQGPAEREYERAVANNTFTTALLNNPEVLNEVSTNFKTAIRYLLAHNMAHVIFTPTPGSDTEVEVDRIAFGLLSSRDVGPFMEFLEQAVRQNEANNTGWGVEASGDGSRVRDRITSLQ